MEEAIRLRKLLARAERTYYLIKADQVEPAAVRAPEQPTVQPETH